MTWHYVVALALIAVLAIVGLVAMKLSLHAYEANLRVTQLGNEQLRLFQQAGQETRSLLQAAGDRDATDQDLALIRARILDATGTMTRNHRDLQALHAEQLSTLFAADATSHYYNEKPYELNRRLRDFVQQAEFVAGLDAASLRAGLADWAPITLALARHGVMVRGFDQMMQVFEEAGRRQIDILKMIMNVATALIIVTLLIEGALIFRPLVRKLRAEHDKLSQSQVHLNYLAHHDALTGLANRTNFQLSLDKAIDRAAQEGSQVTLLLIDLDKFKAVNDTFGHPVGDALLIAIGERLKSWSRDSDLAIRLGGDEFAVILTGLKRPDQAKAIAERLLDHLVQPVLHEAITIHPRCSIGAASFPAEADGRDQLITRADLAMYSAKARAAGVQVYDPTLETNSSEIALLEQELRHGIERGELRIHYQPKLTLPARGHLGFEALVRWQHPARGLLAPAEFLGVADRAGLLPTLTQKILNEVARDIAAWRSDGLDPGVVAVNVPEIALANNEAVAMVKRALHPFGLEGACLMIEITEEVAINQAVDQARRSVEALQEMGVKIAFDDFGTGYASLTHLRSFPFDEIKIDRSFINDLGADPRCDEIVRAILGVGIGLGKTVVAEGVETEAQEAFLIAAGCSLVQGYRYARGLDFDAASHRLRVAA